MATIGDRIRQARDRKGLTQQAVATALGVSRVAVTDWERDKNKPEISRVPRIVELLGGTADWYLNGVGASPFDQDNSSGWGASVPNATVGDRLEGFSLDRIPVYGQAVGGVHGEFVMNGVKLYDVLCPPSLAGNRGAYAVSVSGDSMEPRYFDGEIAYIDPTRRAKRGDFVIAQIQSDDDSAPLAYVKRFVKHTSEQLVLEQFNPSDILTFPHEKVVSVHLVVMAGAPT